MDRSTVVSNEIKENTIVLNGYKDNNRILASAADRNRSENRGDNFIGRRKYEIIDDDYNNSNCFNIFKQKTLRSTMISHVLVIPQTISKNQLPFYYYRDVGKDFYEALSYCFFELNVRLKDIKFFQMYLENEEKYYFFKNLPKNISLKNHEKEFEEKYIKSYKKFLELIKTIVSQLASKKKSRYEIITEFYEKIQNKGELSFFLKIFMRGYISGFINESNDWEYFNKQKKYLSNFLDLEATTYNDYDLDLVCRCISYPMVIFKISQEKLTANMYPKSYIGKKTYENLTIPLLYENNKFFILNDEKHYMKSECSICNKSFRSSLLFKKCATIGKHKICFNCLLSFNEIFPNKCPVKNCFENFREEDLIEFYDKIERKTQQKFLLCGNESCIQILTIISSKQKTYVCTNCQKENCAAHKIQSFLSEKCFCFCPLCKEKTNKIGDLFPKGKICVNKKCENFKKSQIFCLVCLQINSFEKLCNCYCKTCGGLLENNYCVFCHKKCLLCETSFTENTKLLRKCPNCSKETCRNCHITFINHNPRNSTKKYCTFCFER